MLDGGLDLLLLADEQENMIDKYLEGGTLFALYDRDLKSTCVVTIEGGNTYEIQSLATYPQFQGKGYGRYLVDYVCNYFSYNGGTMVIAADDSPLTVPFYENCGFVFSHRIENYFLEYYDNLIIEAGVQIKDKVHLTKALKAV